MAYTDERRLVTVRAQAVAERLAVIVDPAPPVAGHHREPPALRRLERPAGHRQRLAQPAAHTFAGEPREAVLPARHELGAELTVGHDALEGLRDVLGRLLVEQDPGGPERLRDGAGVVRDDRQAEAHRLDE